MILSWSPVTQYPSSSVFGGIKIDSTTLKQILSCNICIALYTRSGSSWVHVKLSSQRKQQNNVCKSLFSNPYINMSESICKTQRMYHQSIFHALHLIASDNNTELSHEFSIVIIYIYY